MKKSFLTAASVALAAMAPIDAHAQSTTFTFPMILSKGPASTCLTHKPPPRVQVTVHSFGDFENLEVIVRDLPPNTGFDLFSIQVPNAPFGLAWYIGDIETDSTGVGVGNFVGRFNIETFVVSPAAVPAPQVFKDPPFPDAAMGVATGPVQLYHLGLWFNSPDDAAKVGCPATVTPFNGEHHAGIQVINTGGFPDLKGPLFHLK
jgi:hypothetical protein